MNETDLKDCNNCGAEVMKTYATPHGQDLCAGCFEDWFNSEEKQPTKWVLQCQCGEILKGTAVQVQCTCGRVWVAFQLY